MMDLANIFALLQEGAQGSQGLLSGITDYLSQLDLGTGELSAGGGAVILAALWFLARVIRTVVSVLFVVCVLLLVLQLAGYVDLNSLWETVSPWLETTSSSVQS